MTVPPAETHLDKQCACEGATASGPRIVYLGKATGFAPGIEGVWRQEFAFVEFACDRCDTPWKRSAFAVERA